ncbi:MAG: adenosylcobinamide-GDP ribazoletransferase [Pseudochelatococcus sp.]|jgi:adenosylcobinamide-GDP ribazoletransferase|uniref:adenosylcobinamide-GDP ribazoletransferase n=1 Tax=Pseudochelatococcus sp. TaxID=2020869 RepID=UPI003D8CDFAC
MTADRPAPLADILHCIGFYTRVPVPALPPTDRPFAARQWAAPIAGLAPAAAGAGLLALALALRLPAEAAAAIAIAGSVLVTGALHEDGLADVADGFGGGRDRDSKLAIMKDSRIGTYGVLALALGCLARWSALAALAAHGMAAAASALVAAHVASRALMPAFMRAVPPARADGLSAGMGRIGGKTAAAALLIGALALLPPGVPFALAAPLPLVIWFFALRRLCRRQIGGQTGDVVGALQQGAEIALLLTACAFLP